MAEYNESCYPTDKQLAVLARLLCKVCPNVKVYPRKLEAPARNRQFADSALEQGGIRTLAQPAILPMASASRSTFEMAGFISSDRASPSCRQTAIQR